MKQDNNKGFEFRDLITLKPLTINIIVLLVVTTFFCLYYILVGINFKLSFMMITFALIVLGITLILKAASSTVHISFTKNSLAIKIDDKINVYKKTNIVGLYSINYNLSKSSRVAFEILFDNGKSIHVSDFEFNDKKDLSKNKQLKKLLNQFIEEVDLFECKKVKSLSLHRMGQYFYSKLNEI
jgi:hypothetical protein